ncbi:MAG: T9SS type B sorting domain-containing protein [Bacteroidetes bacterium]|nr:MAG: T9SS type B sorting domain-containing protein [Bacteroidota bacterium]
MRTQIFKFAAACPREISRIEIRNMLGEKVYSPKTLNHKSLIFNLIVFRRKLLVILFGLNLLQSIISSAQAPPQIAANTTWMEARGSNQNTGVQLMKGGFNNSTPLLKWQFTDSCSSFTGDAEPLIVDVDGDGNTDIVASVDRGCGNAIYALNGSNGTLKWIFTVPPPAPPSAPAVADIDGNGTMEVVFGADSIYVLDGITGTRKWIYPVFPGMGNQAQTPTLADVDNNGDMEIIIPDQYFLYVLDGTTAALQWSYPVPFAGAPAVADIDGNGDKEIILNGYSGGVPAPAIVALDGTSGLLQWAYPVLNTGSTYSSPAVADIDGDGDMDVVSFFIDGSAAVQALYALDGTTGTLLWTINIAASLAVQASFPAIADIDGNGSMEVVIGDGNGVVHALSGATGAQIWSFTMSGTGSWWSGSPKIGDFNPSSPCLETIVSTSYNSSGTSDIYMLSSTGGLLWNYQNPGFTTEGISAGDIDDDGCVEIVVTPDVSNGSIYGIFALDDVTGSSNCGSLCGLSCASFPLFSISVTPNTSICAGQTVTLTAASGGTNYSWSTGATTSVVAVTPTVTTTYSVITSNGSCSAVATVTITVSPPQAAYAISATICAGQIAILTASGGGNYLWSNGATTSSITAATAGSYSVIVSVGSCSDTASASVVVNPNPVAAAFSNVTITQGQSTTLSASGGGTYLWSNGSTDSVITVMPLVTTLYCVTVTNVTGCKDTACVQVTVKEIPCKEIFIPNAFSPNNDGENELECVMGNCIETFSFAIYDRWGEKVFETTDQKICWDGKYKGKLLNTAMFVYYLEATLTSEEKITKKGNISLIR